MSSVSEGSADIGNTGSDQDTRRLNGSMGVFELVFTVVAYNGPVVVFLGFLPALVLLGNGIGAPVAILASGVLVLMVAVGLIKVAGRLDRPGGFYALITAGLGREAGLAAGFAALTCYFLALISVYALGGIALDTVVQDLVSGPDVPWWIYGLAMLAVASVLGYLNINFSAKILVVFLAFELVLMAIYDIAVLVQGGADGIGFDSFTADAIFSGSLSIAFIYAIGLFGGFEATVIFRDEVKDPKRTIPVATYGVIGLLAGMYALTTWCFINSYGAAAIMDVVTADLAGSAPASVEEYVGGFAYDIATIMLFTSSFALVLAAHNITSRYIFNLAADGIFPRTLGDAHPRHVSPHRASIVLSIISLATILLLAVMKLDEATIYARLAGLYSYTFVMLLVFVALAVGVFLLRGRGEEASPVSAILSLIGCAALLVILVLATQNFDYLSGAVGTAKTVLLSVIWGVTALGAVVALSLRRSKPEVYARIGRQ